MIRPFLHRPNVRRGCCRERTRCTLPNRCHRSSPMPTNQVGALLREGTWHRHTTMPGQDHLVPGGADIAGAWAALSDLVASDGFTVKRADLYAANGQTSFTTKVEPRPSRRTRSAVRRRQVRLEAPKGGILAEMPRGERTFVPYAGEGARRSSSPGSPKSSNPLASPATLAWKSPEHRNDSSLARF